MIYVSYEDDGPLGICGQTVDITGPWRKLFICEGLAEYTELATLIKNKVTRRNQHIAGIWSSNPENCMNEVIIFQPKEER